MKSQPLIAAALVLLLVMAMTGPAVAGVCLEKKNREAGASCSVASLEMDPVDGNCPVLSALPGDYSCTADDPAGVISVVCTVGSAVYKGARTAAVKGAKLALTTTTLIVSGLVQIGSLISPA